MGTFGDMARPASHLRVQAAEDCVVIGTDPRSRQVHVPVSLYWTLVRPMLPGPESSHLTVAETQRTCAVVLEVVASPPVGLMNSRGPGRWFLEAGLVLGWRRASQSFPQLLTTSGAKHPF